MPIFTASASARCYSLPLQQPFYLLSRSISNLDYYCILDCTAIPPNPPNPPTVSDQPRLLQEPHSAIHARPDLYANPANPAFCKNGVKISILTPRIPFYMLILLSRSTSKPPNP